MQPQARQLQLVSRASALGRANRWALIVGISRYAYPQLNLKYADRDVEELYQLIQTPSGGNFQAEHIRKLVNEEATTANIIDALRNFLLQPDEDDLVLMYFACHGGPDPRRPRVVYLLTHDTDPANVSGTALRMSEIEQSLRDYLLARRVVIIADTCHSASIGGGMRSANANNAEITNRYLEEVSKAKEGVALLTSAAASEVALEDKQWGGGHGVFTHFLLQGMRGDADGYGRPKDGFVTVGELFEYVRGNVIRATNAAQHPTIGTNEFDPNLPLAITGGINAQEHYQLGCHLYELGWLLDDPARCRAATAQFAEALRLSSSAGTPFPEAELRLGQSLVASGEAAEAIPILHALIARSTTTLRPDALFYLGLAHAKERNYTAAIQIFEQYVAQCPQADHAAWVGQYVAWLKRRTGGQKYALLIGINQYVSVVPLQGCLNDVQFMKMALTQRYGFEEANVYSLLDHQATRQGILDALEALRQRVRASDTVLVHYSGHSVPESRPDAFGAQPVSGLYLVVHDTTEKSDRLNNGITVRELHERIKEIPAEHKTLILDTHPSNQFIELVESDGNYTLLLASDSAEIVYEHPFNLEGKLVPAGLFSGVLSQQLEEVNPDTVTYGHLVDTSIGKIKDLGYDQTPLLIGEREQRVFGAEDIYMSLFEFAQRGTHAALTSETLDKRYAQLCQHVAVPFPQAHCAFGRAFLEKGHYNGASEALQTALRQRDGDYPDAVFALGKAQVGARCDAEALASFRVYAASDHTAPFVAHMQALIAPLERLVRGRKYALLVGINEYISPQVAPVRGAVNDVYALNEVLVTTLGFQAENIAVLLDHEAIHAAIVEAFKDLVAKASEEPALFYFAGNGSIAADGTPTIVSADGRQAQVYDIDLRELSELAQSDRSNLVTIMDAGWTRYREPVEGSRTIPDDPRERPGTRHVGAPRDIDASKLTIGASSIYSSSLKMASQSFPTVLEKEFKEFPVAPPSAETKIRGILTQALVQSLRKADARHLTYAQWIGQLESARPIVLADNLNELVFDSRSLRADVLEHVKNIEQEPIREAIEILRLLIEQRERRNEVYPEGHLNLGIAYAAVDEYDKSIQALERAIAQYGDPTVMAMQKAIDPHAEDHYYEARYQLGRVFFESERDFTKAVSELKEATRLDPNNVRAYYYLGQAIRAMVDRETLTKAEEALQTYLAKGAPLGHENEVRQFLGSRVKSAPLGDKGAVQDHLGAAEQEVTR